MFHAFSEPYARSHLLIIDSLHLVNILSEGLRGHVTKYELSSNFHAAIVCPNVIKIEYLFLIDHLLHLIGVLHLVEHGYPS